MNLLKSEEGVECFLSPKGDINSSKNIVLPNLQEVIIGRNREHEIMDLACSKKQLMLEADIPTKTVRIRRIGRNPSLLAGFPMEQNQDYTAREGMVLQITPDIEYVIAFQLKETRKKFKNDTQSQANLSSRQFNWSTNPSGTVLCCKTSDLNFGSDCKIASFDLDGTLITTKSGYKFPSNDDDWKLWHEEIPKHLKSWVKKDFTLVMFTNQAGLEVLSQTRKESFKKKVENVIRALDVPFFVAIATSRDICRKPAPGMWEFCISKIPDKVNMDSSFYVGDAAGRLAVTKPKKASDFDITDRLFARNIGLKFYTPEEFFWNDPPRPFQDVSFHPSTLPTESYPDLNISSATPELIVMVGCPASGKSYFVQTILESNGYIRVSRDELRSWPKARGKMVNAILNLQKIVYDATNPDKETRKSILDMCKEQSFTNARCFMMTTSKERCIHNNKFRQLTNNSVPVPHTAIVSYYKRYEEPSIEEGFVSVVKIPFVPTFQNLEHKELYKKYLLGRT